MIEHCVIGPCVSLSEGALIEDSRVKKNILRNESELFDANFAGTLTRCGSELVETPSRLNVGDSRDIHL